MSMPAAVDTNVLLPTYNSNDFTRMFPALEVIVPPAPADTR